jgi:ABC-2 type transport system ATP-binding protein
VEDVEKLLGLDFLDRRIREYSSGMRKKLSIAQALVGNPKLVMLDEPLANLDFNSMKSIVRVVTKLRDDTNFLIISHIWEPFLPIVDRVYVIAGGKLIARGEKEEIVEKLKALYSLSEQ